MKLKILLIDPYLENKGLTTAPLSSGMIGSYLLSRMPDHNVKVLKSASSIVSYIKNEKPDVLGVTNFLWNTNLAMRISHLAREVNPDTLVVFGGPEVNRTPLDKKQFVRKYAHVDILVEHEGEIAFYKIIENFLRLNGDRRRIREAIDELGNSFYVDEKGEFVFGPFLPRIQDPDIIPSPYMQGLMDEFLADRNYQPLIQTNRGCPYSCTFCVEGSEYFSKIRFFNPGRVMQELDYIVDHIGHDVGLHIADSNWGMYPPDVAIATHLRHLQDTRKWPLEITVSTGKSQPERIRKVAEIVNGAILISNSVQSMNEEVLSIIRRKNLSDEKRNISDGKMVQEPEFILPLPRETADSFLAGLNQVLNVGKMVRLKVYPALLLSDTQMQANEATQSNGLRVMYRQHQNLNGICAGQFVSETERVIVSTSHMSMEDVLHCRIYAALLDSLLRHQPLSELFRYLDSAGLKRSDLTMKLFASLVPAGTDALDDDGFSAPAGIRAFLEEYNQAFLEEIFNTEEEALTYIQKNTDAYSLGHKGGDLLKYSMGLWIEHYDSMMDWIFDAMKQLLGPESRDEVRNIEFFLRCLYQDRDRDQKTKKLEQVTKHRFDFDLLAWSRSPQVSPLGDYQTPSTYEFRATEVSGTDQMTLWRSFGFFRQAEQHATRYGALDRLHMGRLRRTVT